MTRDILDRAAEAAEGTTPGPWSVEYKHGQTRLIMGDDCVMCDETYYPWVPENERDWHLFAASRQLVPDMAEEIRRLRAAQPRILIETLQVIAQGAGRDAALAQSALALHACDTLQTPRPEK
jgi:hypothetical protein